MAMATCVFTCNNWFSISRITCLISFSGFSALSTRSFRFARIKVATRSINDISILHSQTLLSGSTRRGQFRTPEPPYCDQNPNRNAHEQPRPQMTEEVADHDAVINPRIKPYLKPVFVS